MDLVHSKNGAAFIFCFIVLISLTVIALAFITMIHYEMKSAQAGMHNMQAFYLAEAGLARARWALTAEGEAVGWSEADISLGEGTYSVTTTDNGDGTYTISSEGYVPDDTNPKAKRLVEERNIQVGAGDGTNLSLAASASASSVQGVNTADKAIDGNGASKWKSSVNNGSWLKLDFGSGTTVDKIIYDGSKIDSFTLQYSNDDAVYQPVTNASESPSGTVTFDSILAQYLRFNVNGNKPEVNELESYDSSSGSLTLGQGNFITSW